MYSTGCSFSFFQSIPCLLEPAAHPCLHCQMLYMPCVCANMLVKHQVSAQWQSSKHWHFSPPAKRNQSCDALGAASPCHSCENTCKWYCYLLAAFMPNSMAFKSFCQGQDLHHTLVLPLARQEVQYFSCFKLLNCTGQQNHITSCTGAMQHCSRKASKHSFLAQACIPNPSSKVKHFFWSCLGFQQAKLTGKAILLRNFHQLCCNHLLVDGSL